MLTHLHSPPAVLFLIIFVPYRKQERPVHLVIGPPTENDRKVEDGTVIAVATVTTGERQSNTFDFLTTLVHVPTDQVVRLPVVGVEQGDWVEEVHVSRKNGDSRYGYILYLPLS